MAHGWSRNRDRMMNRARMFGKWGFTCVMHSAGDHGNSSARRWMNAPKFSRDMVAVMEWVGEPVILYGHSAGAAAAAITAFNHPQKVRLLFLEGCYPYTRAAMWNLYYWFSPWFARLFGKAILFWMDLLYKWRLDTVDPARLIKCLPMPIMIIHGEKDGRFPVHMARALFAAVPTGNAELFIAKGAGHSDSSRMPGYEEAVKDFLTARLPGFSG